MKESAKFVITKEALKRFLIDYHHLRDENQLQTLEDIHNYIKKVGCIQYDPINVLSFNSHLVLQSKVASYRPAMLDKLLYEDFTLIDGWDKNLSIYATEDHGFFEVYRRRSNDYYEGLDQSIKDFLPRLRSHLKEGPICSADIKDSPTIDWWWAPTKAVRAALDYMFLSGETYVHHKVNTRKYYDLISHHPLHDAATSKDFATMEAYHDWHVLRRINGVGVLPARRNSYAFIAINHFKAVNRIGSLNRLLGEGKIKEFYIEGVKDPYYIDIKNYDNLLLAMDEDKATQEKHARILAPLDNLLWDRQMVRDVFDFDYIWEVYVPEDKRQYGYYVIPLLYGNDLVGRLVAKFNRTTRDLEIHRLYLEPKQEPDEMMTLAFAHMFIEFTSFLGADTLKIMPTCNQKKWLGQIKKRYTLLV